MNYLSCKKYKKSRGHYRPTQSYFSLAIFSKPGLAKAILFSSMDTELQALQNARIDNGWFILLIE
jgi:hypothetical protein